MENVEPVIAKHAELQRDFGGRTWRVEIDAIEAGDGLMDVPRAHLKNRRSR